MAKTKRHNRRIAHLRRRGPRRKPKRLFVLVCEGQNTEPCYFRALQSTFTSALVELDIVGGVGVPVTVAERAAERARHLYSDTQMKSSFEERDQVWAVFDVDDHPRLGDAMTLCDADNVQVGCSNPCFELWLILHERDYDQACTSKEMQDAFQVVHPEYNRKRGKMPNCE